MRFAIMQGTPGYYADAAAAEEAIAGQEGTVLRLLILHRGHPLTKEEIARHLTRPGKRAVSPGSVPGYIRRLRKRIGPDRIRSGVGYSAAIDSADVDAFAFENLVEAYDVSNIADVDNVAPEHLDMYEKLLDLHAMWKANPALPFADDQDDEFLASRYHDFERYWDCLRRCIIYVELRSRRKPRIEKAISRLEQLLGQDPYDEQSWALLYRARASLPGGETAASSILARIREQFPGGIPGELRYTINRITNGHNDALFGIDRGPRTDEDQRRINELVQILGLSPASELELRRSKLEPLECISQTVSQLRFAGILATKWVADSYVLARFTRLLERLDHSGRFGAIPAHRPRVRELPKIQRTALEPGQRAADGHVAPPERGPPQLRGPALRCPAHFPHRADRPEHREFLPVSYGSGHGPGRDRLGSTAHCPGSHRALASGPHVRDALQRDMAYGDSPSAVAGSRLRLQPAIAAVAAFSWSWAAANASARLAWGMSAW